MGYVSEIETRGLEGEVIDSSAGMLDATLIRVLDTGREDVVHERRLYRLSRPVLAHSGPTLYVTVSAVSSVMGHGHPETMVFAANSRGEEIDMMDMACVWEFDHDAALRAIGVEVVL